MKMSSQPQDIASSAGGYTTIACLNEIMVLQNGRLLFTKTVDYEPSCIDIHPGQSEVAVGGSKVSHCILYHEFNFVFL